MSSKEIWNGCLMCNIYCNQQVKSNTRGNHSSQMQSNTGNRPIYTQAQRGVVCSERTSNEDHTWLLNPVKQNSPGLQELQNPSAIKRCSFTKTELEMDNKIKENKAKLQKKLQKLEEKLRQNNLREPADALKEEREKRGRAVVRDAGMMVTQGKRQDIKVANLVVQYLQLQRKEDKTPKITFHGQKMLGGLHLQRTDSVTRLIRGKGDGDSRENTSNGLHTCAGKEERMGDNPKRPQMSQHEISDRIRGPAEETEKPLLPPIWSPQPRITAEVPKDFQLLSCSVCNRSFESKRLEAHFRICRKVSTSQRPLYDGKRHRTKGTELEQFLKTHSGTEPTKVAWSILFSPIFPAFHIRFLCFQRLIAHFVSRF